jgi:hypothetical protein
VIRYAPATLNREETFVLVGRHRETPRYRFRSDRTFHSNGAWYFATRESIAVGPYVSRAEAEAAVRELVARLANAHDDAARGMIIDSQTAALLAADEHQDPQAARTG